LKQKAKEKNYFGEICTKKVCSKMDQQQMGNAKKSHNKTSCPIKSYTLLEQATEMDTVHLWYLKAY